MKQMKAEKKAAKKNGNGATIMSVSDIPTPPSPPSLSLNVPLQHSHKEDYGSDATAAGHITANAKDKDGGSFIQKRKSKKQESKEWTLSGREAEALHMSEEDDSDEGQHGEENSNESGVKDPLQRMLQSG